VITDMSSHFSPADLRQRVEQILADAGGTQLTIEDLEGIDHMHIEGPRATVRLAGLADIGADDVVLDAGCGLGGSARYLASTFGCTVKGIDMTEPLLETGTLFNELTGLSDKVKLQRGDVTDIGFPNASFDVVWTQHAGQSVEDKERFISELHRVLKPGGRLVMHDFFRGPGETIHFPSLCGPQSAVFLISAADLRGLLESTGFEVAHWADLTEVARAENSGIGSREVFTSDVAKGVPGLDMSIFGNMQVLMEMAANSVKDFDEGSVGLFEAVLRKR
jgi:ubiquinone/menaquinone biosynthesis C-methylase UbiE